MNEEIVVNMGLDATGFHRALKSTKGALSELKDHAREVGEGIRHALELAGIGLGLSELLEAGKKIMEFGAHISNTAEDIGVSTTFLQQFDFAASHTGATAEDAEKGLGKLAVKIGEARGGSEEAAASFTKWGIALNDASGKAKSVEEITTEAAKRINDIEDPAVRASMAFDLFGKSGVKLVGTLLELEKLKEDSKGKIVSENELAILQSAAERSKNLGENLKTIGAKVLAPFLVVFGLADANAGLNKFVKDLNKSGGEPVDLKQTKEYVAALEALRKAKQAASSAGMDETIRLVTLRGQELDIQERLNKTQAGSTENLKAQKELVEKHAEVVRAQDALEKKGNEEKTRELEKQKDFLKKQSDAIKEINDAFKDSRRAEGDLEEAKESRAQYTIGELANSRFNFGGGLGNDQGIARQISQFERYAAFNKEHGDVDTLKYDLSRIDDLKKGLSSNVLETEREPFRRLEERAAEQSAHLKTLVDKAVREGLVVIPKAP